MRCESLILVNQGAPTPLKTGMEYKINWNGPNRVDKGRSVPNYTNSQLNTNVIGTADFYFAESVNATKKNVQQLETTAPSPMEEETDPDRTDPVRSDPNTGSDGTSVLDPASSTDVTATTSRIKRSPASVARRKNRTRRRNRRIKRRKKRRQTKRKKRRQRRQRNNASGRRNRTAAARRRDA